MATSSESESEGRDSGDRREILTESVVPRTKNRRFPPTRDAPARATMTRLRCDVHAGESVNACDADFHPTL